MTSSSRLTRHELIELVRMIRAAQDNGLPYEELLSLLDQNVPGTDARNLCNTDYPDETVVDLCLGWHKTQRTLTREELVQLVKDINSGPAETEAEDMLRTETFIYNCRHSAKSGLMFYPEQFFEGRTDPTAEEIVDKALRGDDGDSSSEERPTVRLSAEGMRALSVLFFTIESPQFAAAFAQVRELKRFIYTILRQPDATELNQLVDGSEEAQRIVLDRLRELAGRANDCNRWDIALAVYVWALASNPQRVSAAAVKLMDREQNSWARKMAAYWSEFFQRGAQQSADISSKASNADA